jgi:glycosyltransferase involved in cell wall biosynthesis
MLRPGVAQVLGAIPALARYLSNERPEAILGVLDYANFATILARRLAGLPVRTVASVHNHMSSAAANAQRPHLRHVIPLARRLYPDADAVVCVSDGVANDLAASVGVPSALLTTIYNPVITPRILELAGAPAPHRWFAPGDVPVILGVGKFRRQKDFATLIRAFARLRKKYPAHLILLGDGPERAELERLTRELGIASEVDMPGFNPNPYAFMARASVFVLSSRWEGFGNVLVEAMACGCPVVSTDCPSGPAEILANGRYGKLVPVGDERALANTIVAQIDAPIGIDEAACRANEFTAATSAARYEEILFPEI